LDAARVLTPPPVSGEELTDREREILAFERQWWRFAGAKEQAIRELFGLSATRYYQVLNALIDRPAALTADPMLVKRLRRLRNHPAARPRGSPFRLRRLTQLELPGLSWVRAFSPLPRLRFPCVCTHLPLSAVVGSPPPPPLPASR